MSALAIPYFKQDTVYSCGAAAAQMILRYFGVVYSERVLMERLKTEPKEGTHHQEIIDLFTDEDLYCYVNNNSSLAEVAFYLDQCTPVLIHYIEPSDSEGHYAVLTAVENGIVTLNDPWNGEGFALAEEDFSRRWRSEDGEFICWMTAVSDTQFHLGRSYNPSM